VVVVFSYLYVEVLMFLGSKKPIALFTLSAYHTAVEVFGPSEMMGWLEADALAEQPYTGLRVWGQLIQEHQ
jgi:hypothetical protein